MTSQGGKSLLLLAALCWGVTNVLQKTVLSDVGPFTAVGIRCLIGLVVVLPFVWRDLARAPRLDWAEAFRLLEIGLLFMAAIVLGQMSFGATTVTNGSFLVNTTTVMTPLAAWWLTRQRPAAGLWISVAVATTGALLISGASVAPFQTGDFLCLASAALYSVWFVRIGGVVARTGRSGQVVVSQFLLAGLVSISIGFMLEDVTREGLDSGFTELMLLAIFGTGLPYGIQAVAQKYVTAPAAAVVISAESVFGAVAAAAFLGERLTLGLAVGAALVVLSILILPVRPATIVPRASEHA